MRVLVARGRSLVRSDQRELEERGDIALVGLSQALSSSSNFLAALIAVRMSAHAEYGAIALLFAAYGAAVTLVRPIAGGILQISVGRSYKSGPLAPGRVVGSLVIAFAAGTLAAIVSVLAFGPAMPGSVRVYLVLALMALPALLCHDTLRLWCISDGHPIGAVCLDLGWWALMLGGLVGAAILHTTSAGLVAATWAWSGAVVGIVATLWAVWAGRRRRDVLGALRSAATRGAGFLADALLVAVSNQGLLLLAPALVPLAQLGRLQTTELVFGLVSTPSLGINLFLQPRTRRLVLRGRAMRAYREAAWGGAGLIALALLITICLGYTPESDMREILGHGYVFSGGILVAVAVKYVAFGPQFASTILSRSIERQLEAVVIRSIATVGGFALGVVSAGVFSLPAGYFALYIVTGLGSITILHRQARWSRSCDRREGALRASPALARASGG